MSEIYDDIKPVHPQPKYLSTCISPADSLLVRLHSYTEKDQYYCQMDRYASKLASFTGILLALFACI